MSEPEESGHVVRAVTLRIMRVCKNAVRYHWDSFGKAGAPQTHLRSILVAAVFLLVAYLITV